MMMASEGSIVSTSSNPAIQHKGSSSSSFIAKLCCRLSSLKMHPNRKEITETAVLSCTDQRAPVAVSREFDRVFNYFDENGDGKISPDELRECMKVVGEELSLEEAEEVVHSVDSDGDGLLGFDDFVMLVDGQGEEEKGRSLKEAFEVYEMKGEGCITAKSLRKALRLLGDYRSIEECKAMIRKFDENGDGVISFDEFRNMMV